MKNKNLLINMKYSETATVHTRPSYFSESLQRSKPYFSALDTLITPAPTFTLMTWEFLYIWVKVADSKSKMRNERRPGTQSVGPEVWWTMMMHFLVDLTSRVIVYSLCHHLGHVYCFNISSKISDSFGWTTDYIIGTHSILAVLFVLLVLTCGYLPLLHIKTYLEVYLTHWR